MSDKKLIEKLPVKQARRLALIEPPDGIAALLADAPLAEAVETAEVVLAFARSQDALARTLPALAARLMPGAILWLGYPKLGSPLAGDLSRDVIHRAVPPIGLDTVAQIAIDATWSALRLKIMPG